MEPGRDCHRPKRKPSSLVGTPDFAARLPFAPRVARFSLTDLVALSFVLGGQLLTASISLVKSARVLQHW